MTRILLLLVPLVALVALIALFAGTIERDPSLVPSALIDKPVPQYSLPPLQGSALPGLDPAALRGQVSVVNVFASWCVPCRVEHPLLMELPRRAEVFLVGINQRDAPENARAFLAELGNPFDAIGADANGRASIEWGVYGVPETFVVNPAGTIVYKHVGPLSRASFETSLLPAIAAAAGDR